MTTKELLQEMHEKQYSTIMEWHGQYWKALEVIYGKDTVRFITDNFVDQFDNRFYWSENNLIALQGFYDEDNTRGLIYDDDGAMLKGYVEVNE